MTITIEKGAEHSPTYCECCGRTTRVVNGYASDEVGALAAYVVQWTDGHVAEIGAHFDLIIGEWGGATASNRVAVSLEYRMTETGPSFRVVDASNRDIATSPLVGEALNRDDVIGTPFAKDVFAIVDAIWLQDSRVLDLHPAFPN